MKTENMKSNQVKQIICQTGDFYDKIIKKEKNVSIVSKLWSCLFLLKDGYDSDDFM